MFRLQERTRLLDIGREDVMRVVECVLFSLCTEAVECPPGAVMGCRL